jgi:translocator assembly and maintenance protein 41
MGWTGPSLITKMQRRFPPKDAHVLFHVVDDPVPMKYGVVDQEDLLRDLTQWESLYLAGRLHKPTLPLLSTPDKFASAQDQNLQAAVAALLLLMPSSSETTKNINFCFVVSIVSTHCLSQLHWRLSNASRWRRSTKTE